MLNFKPFFENSSTRFDFVECRIATFKDLFFYIP